MVELVGIGLTASLEIAELIDFSWIEQAPKMPVTPKNPEVPNSLYVYCTADSPKINLILAGQRFDELKEYFAGPF